MSETVLAMARNFPRWFRTSGLSATCGRWLRSRREAKRLRLTETLSLGERRFVAVVEFERKRYLLGGTAASVVLLAELDAAARDENGGDER
jgi:flagellar biogenesis protein FliO